MLSGIDLLLRDGTSKFSERVKPTEWTTAPPAPTGIKSQAQVNLQPKVKMMQHQPTLTPTLTEGKSCIKAVALCIQAVLPDSSEWLPSKVA